MAVATIAQFTRMLRNLGPWLLTAVANAQQGGFAAVLPSRNLHV